jgi:hypothetical protein
MKKPKQVLKLARLVNYQRLPIQFESDLTVSQTKWLVQIVKEALYEEDKE